METKKVPSSHKSSPSETDDELEAYKLEEEVARLRRTERDLHEEVVSVLFQEAVEDEPLSESPVVNLLVNFRAHVDAFDMYGIFDDTESPMGQWLQKELKGGYEALNTLIEEHIEQARAEYKQRERNAEPRPYALLHNDVTDAAIDALIKANAEAFVDGMHTYAVAKHAGSTDHEAAKRSYDHLQGCFGDNGSVRMAETAFKDAACQLIDAEFRAMPDSGIPPTLSDDITKYEQATRDSNATDVVQKTQQRAADAVVPGTHPEGMVDEEMVVVEETQARLLPPPLAHLDWRPLFPKTITGMLAGAANTRANRRAALKQRFMASNVEYKDYMQRQVAGRFAEFLWNLPKYAGYWTLNKPTHAFLTVLPYLCFGGAAFVPQFMGAWTSLGILALSEVGKNLVDLASSSQATANASEALGTFFSVMTPVYTRSLATRGIKKAVGAAFTALGLGGGLAAGLAQHSAMMLFSSTGQDYADEKTLLQIAASIKGKPAWPMNAPIGSTMDDVQTFVHNLRQRINDPAFDEAVWLKEHATMPRAKELLKLSKIKNEVFGPKLRTFVNLLWRSGNTIADTASNVTFGALPLVQLINFYRNNYRPDRARAFLHDHNTSDPGSAAQQRLADHATALEGLRRIYINGRSTILAAWNAGGGGITVQAWLEETQKEFLEAKEKWETIFQDINEDDNWYENAESWELQDTANDLAELVVSVEDERTALLNRLNCTDAVIAQLNVLNQHWYDPGAMLADAPTIANGVNWLTAWRKLDHKFDSVDGNNAGPRVVAWNHTITNVNFQTEVHENWYMLYRVLDKQQAYMRGRPNTRAPPNHQDSHNTICLAADLVRYISDMRRSFTMAIDVAGKDDEGTRLALPTGDQDDADAIENMFRAYFPNERPAPPPPPGGDDGGDDGGGGRDVHLNDDEFDDLLAGFGQVPAQGGGGADDGAGVVAGASVVDEVFARLHLLRL